MKFRILAAAGAVAAGALAFGVPAVTAHASTSFSATVENLNGDLTTSASLVNGEVVHEGSAGGVQYTITIVSETAGNTVFTVAPGLTDVHVGETIEFTS
jgi:hypothetical protein